MLGVIIPDDYIDILRKIPVRELGVLFKALMDSTRDDGVLLGRCSPATEGLYVVLAEKVRKARETASKRSENGKQGGRPRKSNDKANGKQTESKSKATANQEERDEKESSKEKVEKEETSPLNTPDNKNTINTTKREKTFIPPTEEQVIDYARTMGYRLNVEQFVSFYQSKNWFVGKNKMKDWKAAVRGWVARDKERNPQKDPSFGRHTDYDALTREMYYGGA